MLGRRAERLSTKGALRVMEWVRYYMVGGWVGRGEGGRALLIFLCAATECGEVLHFETALFLGCHRHCCTFYCYG